MTHKYVKMSNNRSGKHYDHHILYVTSGVAREEQLHRSLRAAIKDGEERLYNETLKNFLGYDQDEDYDNETLIRLLEKAGIDVPEKQSLECKIRVNLIVNKDGEYYGFGYIHVARKEVYWMLLGKNPDGSDRVLEYLDPNWQPPQAKPANEETEKYANMRWYEIVEEEDKNVHPKIKKVLPPLMVVPGYVYDEQQYKHHQEIADREGKDPATVPTMGFFELSRAYVKDVEPGKIENVLCARQVPPWIPPIAFKQIFRDYVSDKTTLHKIKRTDSNGDDEWVEDTYPMINLVKGRKDAGNIVFITFEPGTKEAMFALLMTRKVTITHPKNPSLNCVLVFDHAYEQGRSNNKMAKPMKKDYRDRRDNYELKSRDN